MGEGVHWCSVLITLAGRRLRAVRDLFRPKNTDPPSVTASSDSLSVSESSGEADEDGDVFVDASDVTPSNSIVSITEVSAAIVKSCSLLATPYVAN